MALKNLITTVASAALLSGAALSTPVMAQGNAGFSALQGVEAQALSVDEMQAIQGSMSLTNLNQLIIEIKNDPRINDRTEKYLVSYWTKAYYSMNGTKYQPVLDAAFTYLQQNVYTSMCAVNMDFCTGPFPSPTPILW